MKDLENIRSFKYRPSRMGAGFKVRFASELGTVDGICRNISENGLRAELLEQVEVETLGRLTIYHPHRTVDLEAKVAYLDGAESGFEFQFRTGWERESVLALLSVGVSLWMPPAVRRLP